MGEIQLWQYDGLGTDAETLDKVIRIFKCDGVQGIESQSALENYIEKLDDSSLRKMYEINAETTLQILADCFGVVFAARKYSKWENEVINTAINILQKEKETAEQQIKELQNTLAHYKADLYDFYAQAGKLPNHERG